MTRTTPRLRARLRRSSRHRGIGRPWVWIIAGIAAACTQEHSRPVAASVSGSSQVITSASGGTLTIGSGTLAGLELRIPAGAVGASVTVSARQVGDLAGLGSLRAVGPAVEFSPEGASFQRPAALTLPFDADRLSPNAASDLVVVRQGSVDAALEILEVIALGQNRASTEISGFSTYQISVRPHDFSLLPRPLPQAVLGASYRAEPRIVGGSRPYTWKVSAGQLPPGLTLDGQSGVLSGTPSGIGIFSFTLEATETLSNAARQFNELPGLNPALTVSARTATQSFSVAVSGRVDFAIDPGDSPALAVGSVGGVEQFVVVWASSGRILARRHDVLGAALDIAPIVVSTQGSAQRRPRAGAGAEGQYFLVWEDARGTSTPRVQGRLLNADGTLGEEATLDQSAVGQWARLPDVAGHGGGYLACWEASKGADSRKQAQSDIYARRFDATGAALADEQRVDESDEGDSPGSPPRLAVSGTTALCVWTDRGTPGVSIAVDAAGAPIAPVDDPEDVYGRTIDLASGALGLAGVKLSGEVGGAARPAVAGGDAIAGTVGGFAVVFHRLETIFLDPLGNPYASGAMVPAGVAPTQDTNVYMAIVSSTGIPGAAIRVDDDPARAFALGPSITRDSKGQWTVAWLEELSQGPQTLVRRFDAQGVAQGAPWSLGIGNKAVALGALTSVAESTLIIVEGLTGLRFSSDPDAVIAAPVLTAPPAFSKSATVTITWPEVYRATSYVVESAADASFATVAASSEALTASTFTSTEQTDGATVFFRARAKNAAGLESANSTAVSTTIDLTNPVAAFTAPTSTSTVSAGAATAVTWTTTDANPGAFTLSVASGAVTTVLADGLPDTGSFSWTVPTSMRGAPATLTLTVTDKAGNTATVVSDALTVQ